MDWLRWHHGTACDAKWLVIARLAGCRPADVLAVWAGLMEHASQQHPRGSIAGFDVETFSGFHDIPADTICRVTEAFSAKKLIVKGQLRAWNKRQRGKSDPTGAERKRRQRARVKTESGELQKEREGVCHAVTTEQEITNLSPCHDASRCDIGVTEGVTLQERERDLSLSISSSSSFESHTPLETSGTSRAGALTPGDVWKALDAEGLGVPYLKRPFVANNVAAWCKGGVSSEQLGEAIKRARAARARDNNPQPINLGYLATFVAEVLSGKPARTTGRDGYGLGDQLSREHAARAR